jgi:hypothetical protein
MSFRELYEVAQGLDTPIDLSRIRAQIGQLLPPGRKCRVIRSAINVDRLTGYYVSGRNEDSLFLGVPPGTSVIVLSDTLNVCWSRFVEVKELMHLFDDPLSFTNSPDELEKLITGMCESISPTHHRSPQLQSEFECFWMAVALFCPEEKRVELKIQRDARTLSDLEIAEMLKMPERCVPHLFAESYKDNVSYLLQAA